jgi:hypothetical protein
LKSLAPRNLILKSTTANEATFQYSLPPTSTKLGGPIDVRVLIRPSRLFKSSEQEAQKITKQISDINMKFQMDWTRNAGKPGQNDPHENFLKKMETTRPLEEQRGAIWANYTAKCMELLPVAGSEDKSEPSNGYYIVNFEKGFCSPNNGMGRLDPISIKESPETNTVTITQLASNIFYEVALVAKRGGKTTDDEGQDYWIWSPLSETLGFSTKTAPWQLALEKASLRHFIEPFTTKGLNNFQSWMDIPQSVKEELGIDAAAEQVLADILSQNGIITAAEQTRIDRERVEMVGVVNTLLTDLKMTQDKISTGDAVTEKTPSNKRRGPRFGVVVSVNGDSCSVDWEDPRTKDPANAINESNVKVSHVLRSNFALFLSHAQADAQNQVAHLSVLLRDKDAKIWFDMDSERLEAKDMVRGIANSKVFLLYLTKSYFDRYFCRMEASVAKALNKPLIIVYEADERHGGAGDYVTLVNECTRKFPEFKEFLLTTEAIPMARRSFQRRAVVDEICKRAGLTAKGGSFTEAGKESSTSAAATMMELSDLRQIVLDIKMEMNDLKAENRELREMVEQLLAKHE